MDTSELEAMREQLALTRHELMKALRAQCETAEFHRLCQGIAGLDRRLDQTGFDLTSGIIRRLVELGLKAKN